MELLLWLYIFDNRWLFDIKIKGNIYITLWIISLIINIITLSFGLNLYIIKNSNNYENELHDNTSTTKDITNLLISNFLTIVNIILFIRKILNLDNKEKIEMKNSSEKQSNNYSNNSNDAYNYSHKYLNTNNNKSEFSYWTRRNSAFSFPGLFLFLQSLIPLFTNKFSILELNKIYNEEIYNGNMIMGFRFRFFDYRFFSMLFEIKSYLRLLDYSMIFVAIMTVLVKFINIFFGRYHPKFT